MPRIAKWSVLVSVFVLGALVLGCRGEGGEGCGSIPADRLSTFVYLRLPSGNRVTVGAPLTVVAHIKHFSEGVSSDVSKVEDITIRWYVHPSDGATISSTGVFTASKPGVYEVIGKGPLGIAPAKTTVYVTEAEVNTTITKPATTETEPPATTETTIAPTKTETTNTTEPTTLTTETESTNTSETTATTETAATSFAGTYKGIIPTDLADGSHWDIPWAFTVDAEGKVKGGLDWSGTTKSGLPATMRLTLAGQVSEDGRVTATSTGTVSNEFGTNSGTNSLDGQISGNHFSGAFGSGEQVSATRQ
jgi:hypothetical protein